MTLKEITATPFALPEDVLAVLEENSRVVGFKKNELIIRAGDVDVPFYFIKSGLARIFYTPLSTQRPDPPPPLPTHYTVGRITAISRRRAALP